MGEKLDQIPERLHDHLRSIAAGSGLPEGEESIEAIAGAWLEKKETFERQIAEGGMEEVESFAHDAEGGALAMTYSGSLLTIGPMDEETRRVEYRSIGLRQDVPESAVEEHSRLAEDLSVDEVARFDAGPVRQSSSVFKIAVAPQEMSAEQERELLTSVTRILTEEFVNVNRTVISE